MLNTRQVTGGLLTGNSSIVYVTGPDARLYPYWPSDRPIKLSEIKASPLTVWDKDPATQCVEIVTEELKKGKAGRLVTL